jgi:hypothetical protein
MCAWPPPCKLHTYACCVEIASICHNKSRHARSEKSPCVTRHSARGWHKARSTPPFSRTAEAKYSLEGCIQVRLCRRARPRPCKHQNATQRRACSGHLACDIEKGEEIGVRRVARLVSIDSVLICYSINLRCKPGGHLEGGLPQLMGSAPSWPALQS